MNGSAARFFRLGVGLCVLVAVGWVLTGQAARPANHVAMSVPTDWSHSHLIFSRPATPEMAVRVGEDPRYWQQIARREMTRTLATHTVDPSSFASLMRAASVPAKPSRLHRDWAENMGTGATVGAGNYPAKFAFSSDKANCVGDAPTPDYVVYSTGLAGAPGSQADIVAFTNLYSGCSATPSVFWAYNTSGTMTTSPVLSFDGSQVAFVQQDAANHASLVLLKWAANDGTITGPTAPNSVAAGAYHTCTPTPCMTLFPLTDTLGNHNGDTTSSVFYDYSTDTAWVGDSFGDLHKFQNIFKGHPTEDRTAPWPIQVTLPGLSITSAVFDHVSGNLFMEGADGLLYRVNAASGAVTQLATPLDFGAGGIEGPVVDSGGQFVYVFSSSDGSASCAGGVDCAAVFQFKTTFLATDTGTEVTVGNSTLTGTNPNPMYIGSFDSAYFNSANRTGALYVCGNTGANPTLFQVPILAGKLPVSGAGLAITGLTTGASTATCSPVTDIPNPSDSAGPIERLFVSTQNNGLNNSCTSGGCVYTFVDTPWAARTGFAAGQEILSSKLHVEAVVTAGITAATVPSWTNAAGTLRTDGTVVWIDQGTLTSITITGWTASHHYSSSSARILDTNGNIQVSTINTGNTGLIMPTWNTVVGGTTSDNTVVWKNAGRLGTFALAAKNGTSGIIEDNTVGAGVKLGASQVYFSTLGDQVCPTSGGTGGCAVQASQSALQ